VETGVNIIAALRHHDRVLVAVTVKHFPGLTAVIGYNASLYILGWNRRLNGILFPALPSLLLSCQRLPNKACFSPTVLTIESQSGGHKVFNVLANTVEGQGVSIKAGFDTPIITSLNHSSRF
jgi:hypothetical protein